MGIVMGKLEFVLAALLCACLTARSDVSVFGNSPADGSEFSLAFASGNSFGGAVGFTPAQDINVTSVTLWLSVYTGQNGVVPTASLCENDPFTDQPGEQIASLTAPAPNDGTLAPFTFLVASGQPVLQANQEYWIFVYGSWNGQTNFGGENPDPSWAAGGTPTGAASFDGSEFFYDGNFSSYPGQAAFTVNAAPEPRCAQFLIVAFLLGVLGTSRRFSKPRFGAVNHNSR
jgi:hypothetical protein